MNIKVGWEKVLDLQLYVSLQERNDEIIKISERDIQNQNSKNTG